MYVLTTTEDAVLHAYLSVEYGDLAQKFVLPPLDDEAFKAVFGYNCQYEKIICRAGTNGLKTKAEALDMRDRVIRFATSVLGVKAHMPVNIHKVKTSQAWIDAPEYLR